MKHLLARLLKANGDYLYVVPVLLFLVAILSYPLFTLKVYSFGSDFPLAHIPYYEYGKSRIQTGEIPLWNPYLFSGAPFLANYIANFLNPYIFFVWNTASDLRQALNAYFPVYTFFIVAFMFLFLRGLRLSLLAAAVGSLVLPFSGFGLHMFNFPHMNLVFTLMPLVFWALLRLIESRSLKYGFVLSLALAILLVGGYPQIVYYMLIALFLFAVFCLWAYRSQIGSLKNHSVLVIAIIGFGAWALALAAIQVLPALELLKETTRSEGVGYALSAESATRLKLFLGPLGLSDLFRLPFVQSDQINLGLPFVILALAAVFSRKKFAYFFVFLAVFSLLTSINSPVIPLYSLIYHLPLGSLFKRIHEFAFITGFALAVLSAYGVDTLTGLARPLFPEAKDRKHNIKSAIFITSVSGAAALCLVKAIDLASYLFGRVSGASMPGIPAWQLVTVFAVGLITVFLVLWSSRTATTPLLKLTLVFWAVLSANTYAPTPSVPMETLNIYAGVPSIKDTLSDNDYYRVFFTRDDTNDADFTANLPLEQRFFGVWGYDPIILRRQATAANLLSPNKYSFDPVTGRLLDFDVFSFKDFSPTDSNLKVLGMMNAKYVITNGPKFDSEKGLERTETVKLSPNGPVFYIYRNKEFLPRANLVFQTKVINSEDELVRYVQDARNLDFRNTVLLEKDTVGFNPPSLTVSSAAMATVTEYTPESVTIKVTGLAGAAFVVLSDTYYPGWRVFVDGEQREIYRANYIYRAVQVHPGDSVVEFYYRPLSFRLGLGISLISFIAGCFALVVIGKKRAGKVDR